MRGPGVPARRIPEMDVANAEQDDWPNSNAGGGAGHVEKRSSGAAFVQVRGEETG